MSLTSSTKLLSPEEIAVKAGEPVTFVRLPEPSSVFAERELRLRQLAANHAMRDYLLFVADLARAQHEVLQQAPAMALPDAEAIALAARHGKPPLPAGDWPRDPAWRAMLRDLIARTMPRLPAGPAHDIATQLSAADDAYLEAQADRLLNGVMLGLNLAQAPFIAAALQCYWTQLVAATATAHASHRDGAFGRTDDATACPCCGSRPTASITRIGAEASGHRYLHCSLCSAQWHMVRIKCSHCESTKGIGYHSLEAVGGRQLPATGAAKDAVQIETCDECGHYLKIVHMERDVQVDPVADDLASVTLDLLVSEAGMARHGVNLMLLFGDPEGGPDPGDP